MSHRPFPDFFHAATGLERGPHEYQIQLATGPRLPDVLAVPTGCGKTAAAVLSWAWRRRECPDEDVRRHTPRRLVYCLPMRSLVEQVYGDTIEWLANLNWLRRPSTAPYRPDWSRDDVPVFRLMGGEEAAEWESHPEREAVLVGTQDMLLSRALNRGYAMKPYHWPIAFGLINVDALWVVDEVQLMGLGRTTSVQLQEFRRTPEHLPRGSLWMGVDLDAYVLVTELCPWPFLVQRLGRLNRRGERDGVVHILDLPVKELSNERQRKRSEREQEKERMRSEAALPYAWSDIEAARERVRRLGGDASISAIERVDREKPYEVPVAGPVLRQHHLDDLFDTDPDLSGGHLDVSRFVRGDQMDLDVMVLWRKFSRDLPVDAPAPHPDELCKVPLASLRKLDRNKPGWLLGLHRSRRRSGAWREVRLGDSGIRPGDTVMLEVSVGGYDDELGWVGSEQSLPSSWMDTIDGRRSWVRDDGRAVEDIDNRTETWASLESDPRSHATRWMELPHHLAKAESKARQLADELAPNMADRLAAAGRWHDIGKALERDSADGPIAPFQEMLLNAGCTEPPDPRAEVYYAKSNNPNGRTGHGPGFRHEVASALAYLAEENADDLVAWLVMAHHGKVRMAPMPWNDERMDDVAGVRPGDRLPANAMSFVAREEALDLDPDLLIPSLTHPGWQGRAVKLLEEHGPQFLAYLEALVRIADWRASR